MRSHEYPALELVSDRDRKVLTQPGMDEHDVVCHAIKDSRQRRISASSLRSTRQAESAIESVWVAGWDDYEAEVRVGQIGIREAVVGETHPSHSRQQPPLNLTAAQSGSGRRVIGAGICMELVA